MPYTIKKQGNQWVKIKTATGEIVSHHATKGKAVMSAHYAMQNEEHPPMSEAKSKKR